ncbi:hypothetical protein PGB90_007397 [Kerria lacca]
MVYVAARVFSFDDGDDAFTCASTDVVRQLSERCYFLRQIRGGALQALYSTVTATSDVRGNYTLQNPWVTAFTILIQNLTIPYYVIYIYSDADASWLDRLYGKHSHIRRGRTQIYN